MTRRRLGFEPQPQPDGRCTYAALDCPEPALPDRYVCRKHGEQLEERAAALRERAARNTDDDNATTNAEGNR